LTTITLAIAAVTIVAVVIVDGAGIASARSSCPAGPLALCMTKVTIVPHSTRFDPEFKIGLKNDGNTNTEMTELQQFPSCGASGYNYSNELLP
jgi:hypothetical protein